jgi:hypothetical protein
MTASGDPNLAKLRVASTLLGPLLDEVMLVGGCAAGLLVTDPGASPIRPTVDVDLLVEATTYVDYQGFASRLLRLGFESGTRPGDPICRFRSPSLVVDLMPLEEGVLGFSNRWYASALRAPARCRLPGGHDVTHIDGPHFVASKLEAFRSRGEDDYLLSSDIEDVMVVIDGRARIDTELMESTPELRVFVAGEIRRCIDSARFVEALPGYFEGELGSGLRAGRLLDRLRRIAAGAE